MQFLFAVDAVPLIIRLDCRGIGNQVGYLFIHLHKRTQFRPKTYTHDTHVEFKRADPQRLITCNG